MIDFEKPKRAIFQENELRIFINSKPYEMILLFVRHLSASVKGLQISSEYPISTVPSQRALLNYTKG